MAYNESYKAWHHPKRDIVDENGKLKKGTTHQGYFTQKHKLNNPEKYVGNSALIVYRSGWEESFMCWCDFSPSIVRWCAEPVKVPYYDRVSRLEECKKTGLDPNNPINWVIKNYNVDFWIEISKEEGVTQKMFIEIKPSDKLKKPIPPPLEASLKIQRKFNKDVKEFLINEAKFISMNAFAEKNGAKFYIMTEKQLQPLLGRFWNDDIK